jgi:hypothetical protein
MIAIEPAHTYRRSLRTGPRPPGARWRWLRGAAILALLGVVVIGHGCHGNHVDDELSAVEKPRAGERSR